jgi:hypothetical protein
VRALGKNQLSVLHALLDHGSFPGGWTWDGYSKTVTILESLAKRGLVAHYGGDRPRWAINEAGARAWVESQPDNKPPARLGTRNRQLLRRLYPDEYAEYDKQAQRAGKEAEKARARQRQHKELTDGIKAREQAVLAAVRVTGSLTRPPLGPIDGPWQTLIDARAELLKWDRMLVAWEEG